MTWKGLPLWMRALVNPNRVEDELEEELQFHVAMQSKKNQTAGNDPLNAARLARVQFGALEKVKEECRDERGGRFIEDALADIRYAFRGFGRAPAFVLTVVGTIALALGLNTALFTIFNAYVLRPIAVGDPYSLYRYTWTNHAGVEHSFSWPELEVFRDSNPAFSEIIALKFLFARVEGHPLLGELVTGNYFRMLGVNAFAGRTLVPADALSPGGEPVVVLSYAAWRNKFGGDPDMVGKTLAIRGYPLQVIGIAKPEFSGLGETPRDFWVPITMAGRLEGGPDLFGPGHPNRLEIVGRLRAALTSAQAEAALTVWARQTTANRGQEERAKGTILQSRATTVRLTPQVVAAFAPIPAAFVLVLLIACANIANMMLSRAIARQREIGIRLSLGAARFRLIRQLLTESLLLAFPSALAGFAISEATIHFGQRILFAAMPEDFAQFVTIVPLSSDPRVFGFLFVAAVGSALLFGLAPAVQATRLDVSQAAKGEFPVDFRPARLRNALVVGQITVCALLLICAGLLLRGSARMSRQDVGFRTRGVVEVEFQEKFRSKILSQLAEEPAVQAIAAAESTPLDGMLPRQPMVTGEGTALRGWYNFVSPTFFTALDVPILRGRNFTLEEALSEGAVAIVSQKTTQQFWPNQDALGQTLRIVAEPRTSRTSRVRRFPVVRIVGVAADIVSCCLTIGKDPTLVYLPTTPSIAGNTLLVRVRGDDEVARQKLDARLSAIAPGAIDQIHRMQAFQAGSVFPFRAAAAICSLLGWLALLLTLSGVYSVLSYAVTQRTKEIGIRMALGATAGAVTRIVLRHSMKLAFIGITAGAVMALALWRMLASRLLFIATFDGLAFWAGALVPLAASAAAAYFPARRAARIDPITTLRYD